MRKHVSAR